jgi:hypothetical protein
MITATRDSRKPRKDGRPTADIRTGYDGNGRQRQKWIIVGRQTASDIKRVLRLSTIMQTAQSRCAWFCKYHTDESLGTELLRTYGSIQENAQLRIRYNNEIHGLYEDIYVVTHTKFRSLERAGLICRMDRSRTLRKILKGKIYGSRTVQNATKGAYATWSEMPENC